VDYGLWILVVSSAAATLACWVHLLRTPDSRVFRIVSFIIAAIPVFGPIFYLLSRMPPRYPYRYEHSHGTFFGQLSIEQLITALSMARSPATKDVKVAEKRADS
jgi:hypothetical protein